VWKDFFRDGTFESDLGGGEQGLGCFGRSWFTDEESVDVILETEVLVISVSFARNSPYFQDCWAGVRMYAILTLTQLLLLSIQMNLFLLLYKSISDLNRIFSPPARLPYAYLKIPALSFLESSVQGHEPSLGGNARICSRIARS
jgi:hypothetical protein